MILKAISHYLTKHGIKHTHTDLHIGIYIETQNNTTKLTTITCVHNIYISANMTIHLLATTMHILDLADPDLLPKILKIIENEHQQQPA